NGQNSWSAIRRIIDGSSKGRVQVWARVAFASFPEYPRLRRFLRRALRSALPPWAFLRSGFPHFGLRRSDNCSSDMFLRHPKGVTFASTRRAVERAYHDALKNQTFQAAAAL